MDWVELTFDVLEFKSLDSFTVTGRGRVDVVVLPEPMRRDDASPYIGMRVKINGELREVVGVEMFATLGPIKTVGLLTACPDCGQTIGHYDDCPVGMGVTQK